MRRLLVALALLAAALPAGARAAYPDSFGPVSQNPAEALSALPIERFAYDRATHCVSGTSTCTIPPTAARRSG